MTSCAASTHNSVALPAVLALGFSSTWQLTCIPATSLVVGKRKSGVPLSAVSRPSKSDELEQGIVGTSIYTQLVRSKNHHPCFQLTVVGRVSLVGQSPQPLRSDAISR